MHITIHNFIEGAKEARGLTVVIDVFRAFSLACYLSDQGAEKILPVGNIERAYKLKEENPAYILIGERDEQIMPGFDYGNSPTQIANRDFSGKTIVHTTSAGTQGIVNAVHADEILTGSFVNAGAIISYIKKKNFPEISLVCMGYNAKYKVEEDSYCAEYIRNSLLGIPSDFGFMKEEIRKGSGQRFFIPENQNFAPSSDFDLCLNLNAFNFVLRADGKGEQIELEKIQMK